MLDLYKEKLKQKGEVYLRIKVKPGSSKNEITGIINNENGQTVKISIAAPAEKGRANMELIRFLAKELAVNKNCLKIISGAGDRVKLIKIVNK